MIIPSKINKGDQVILIAPSRKVDLFALEITEEWLKKQELVPLRGEHILKEEGIFAGTLIVKESTICNGHSITQQQR